MTELVTEIPRSFSSAIQSEVAWRDALRDFTLPAIWIAPPNSSSFSVSVVLPASGCEMIANVRRRATSRTRSAGKGEAFIGNETPPAGAAGGGSGGNYTRRARRLRGRPGAARGPGAITE